MEVYSINPKIIKTKKIVINRQHGGFWLSDEAEELYMKYRRELEPDFEKDVEEDDRFSPSYDTKRDDPILVRVVEELGKEANGSCSKLEVFEVRDQPDWDYRLDEYDGWESVIEYYTTPDKKYRFSVDKC